MQVINEKYKLPIKFIQNDFEINEFAQTELIPIYTFLLCAGNFVCIEEVMTEEIEKKRYNYN